MEKKYYIIRERMLPETRAVSTFHGMSFLKTSGDNLEHVARDPSILEIMQIEDGKLRVRDGASSNYEISLVDENKFEYKRRFYSELITREQDERRIPSLREASRATFGENRAITPLGGND